MKWWLTLNQFDSFWALVWCQRLWAETGVETRAQTSAIAITITANVNTNQILLNYLWFNSGLVFVYFDRLAKEWAEMGHSLVRTDTSNEPTIQTN